MEILDAPMHFAMPFSAISAGFLPKLQYWEAIRKITSVSKVCWLA
jgi:hypothetical protein